MHFKSLEHYQRLIAETAALREKLKDSEVGTLRLESHLSDVLADPTSTPADIVAARKRLPEHMRAVAELRAEIAAYETACTNAREAARPGCELEFIEAVQAHTATMDEAWRGFRVAAENLIGVAESVSRSWREYRTLYEAWHKTGYRPTPNVPNKPPRETQQYADVLLQVADRLRGLLKFV